MKKIGIVPSTRGENSFGIPLTYAHYLNNFGDVTIVSLQQITDVDLLILPGGEDVLTNRYNQSPGFYTSKSNQFFEHFDLVLLPQYINKKIPIFGICRGLQTLNVHFNGTLKQDIGVYHGYSTKSRDEEVNNITLQLNLNDRNIKLKNTLKVNSLHHQAIDKLGNGLLPLYVENDGTIEAIIHNELPIAAVQWHPEEIYDAVSDTLIKNLLK